MSTLESLQIDLNQLGDDPFGLELQLGHDYFAAMDADIREGDVAGELCVQRTGDMFSLSYHLEGHVTVVCDRCLEPMWQPVAAAGRVAVKMGTTSADDGDTVVVDAAEGLLDTAWLIYEQIALAVPIKHVHAPGKCNVAMTRKLEELSTARSSDGESGKADDPRWEALKQLQINN